MLIYQPALKLQSSETMLERLDRIGRNLTAQFWQAVGYKPDRLSTLLARKDRLNRIRASVTDLHPLSPVGVCRCCGERIYGPICEHYDKCKEFKEKLAGIPCRKAGC